MSRGTKGMMFFLDIEFYLKPPSKAGRFLVDSQLLRSRVDCVKKLFMTDW